MHGTGTVTGTRKWWLSILCFVLYTPHRTGNHCFLLCPSRSRSRSACMSHYSEFTSRWENQPDYNMKIPLKFADKNRTYLDMCIPAKLATLQQSRPWTGREPWTASWTASWIIAVVKWRQKMQRMLAAVETGCRLQLVKHLFRLASMTFISVNFFSFFYEFVLWIFRIL